MIDTDKNIFSVMEKRILITGASRGIGNSIACGLYSMGAVVMGIALTSEDEMDVPWLYLSRDVSKIEVIDLIKKDILYHFNGKVDGLVNVAGITKPAPAWPDLKSIPFIDNFNETLATNLLGPFLITYSLVPYMKHGGTIVNITSIGGSLGFPDNPAYIASKGGLRTMTKALAIDLARYNIRINSIAPGYIKTDMTKKSYKNKKLRALRERNTILGRFGDPRELLGPCVFLLSDASSYMTGTEIYVDGGWMAKGLV